MESTVNVAPQKGKRFTFLAGEMQIVDKKAKANPDKGEICFYVNEDGILCLIWKNLDKGTQREPLAIVGGDWVWKKIGSQKGRVYALVNTSYPEEKYIFWMQYPSEMDGNISTIVSNILESGELKEDERSKEEKNDAVNKEQVNSVVDVVKNEEKKGKEQQQQQQQVNMGDFIKSFTESMKQFQKKYPELENVLTRLNIEEVLKDLDEENLKCLYKLLPENQQNKQGLYDNIASPQFLQALGQLTHALNSENLPIVISSFQLDQNIANKSINGVEAFINCIIGKYGKKEDGEDGKNK